MLEKEKTIIKLNQNDPMRAALAEAKKSGNELLIDAGDEVYAVRVPSHSRGPQGPLWADYDPERVRAALRRVAGSIDEEEADELKERLSTAREGGSRPAERP